MVNAGSACPSQAEITTMGIFERLLDGGVDLGRLQHVDGSRRAAAAKFFHELGRVVQIALGAERIRQILHRCRPGASAPTMSAHTAAIASAC